MKVHFEIWWLMATGIKEQTWASSLIWYPVWVTEINVYFFHPCFYYAQEGLLIMEQIKDLITREEDRPAARNKKPPWTDMDTKLGVLFKVHSFCYFLENYGFQSTDPI